MYRRSHYYLPPQECQPAPRVVILSRLNKIVRRLDCSMQIHILNIILSRRLQNIFYPNILSTRKNLQYTAYFIVLTKVIALDNKKAHKNIT